MKEENKTSNMEGLPGMYVKIIDNLTKSDIQVKVREWPNLSLAIEAGKTGIPCEFPLPWVSKLSDEGKCILIEVSSLSLELLLWDDKNSSAFFSKNGHWSAQATKVFGNATSWGDFKLIIKENGDLRMDRLS